MTARHQPRCSTHTILFILAALFLAPGTVPAGEQWTYHVPGNDIQDVAFQGDYVWCAAYHSILRWDIRDSTYTQYTAKDYGSVNSPLRIAVDAQGCIWVGFDRGGEVRWFDGSTWTGFDRSVSGLPNTSVGVLLGDRRGNVWFGTDGAGIVCYNGVSWTRYAPGDSIRAVDEAPDGAVWFATNHGLSRFDGASWRTWTAEDGLPAHDVQTVSVAPDGRIWFVADGALGSFDGNEFAVHPIPEGEKSLQPPYSMGPVSVDADGVVWTKAEKTVQIGDDGYRTEGVWRFRNGAWEVFPLDIGWDVYWVSRPFTDGWGALWLIARGGIYRVEGTSCTVFRVNCPSATWTNDIVADRDSVLWFSGGNVSAPTYVSRFDGVSWTNFTPSGEHVIEARNIAVDSENGKWFLGEELIRFDGSTWKTEIARYAFPFNFAPDFTVDRAEIAWFATYGSGLWCWDGSNWKNITAADGLVSDKMQSIAVGPDGRLWAAAVNGLSWFDGGSWESRSSDTPLFDIAVSDDGVVWIRSQRGIVRFDGANWTEFTSAAGLSHLSVNDIALDGDGILWVATFGDGALRYDSREWKRYTTADGLLADRVIAVGVDSCNRKWFATDAGYSVLDDSVPNAVAVSAPASFAHLGNRPNPFNTSTLIEFLLPASGTVELVIYDITGRKIRDLSPGHLPAGRNAVWWNGRDNSGAPVSSGIYISRLGCGKLAVSGRMALVK